MSASKIVFAVLLLTSLCKCAPLTWDDLAHNEDYIGKLVPCSAKEKLCFPYGRLLHEDSGKCYPVGKRGPCIENSTFFVDKETAQRTKNFLGKCVRDDQWPEPWFEKKDNQTFVFVGERCKQGRFIQRNIFGEYVCMPHRQTFKKLEIFQPGEENQCRVPDFLHFVKQPFTEYVDTKYMWYYAEYDPKEEKCLLQGQIYWPNDDSCHSLPSKELCEGDNWLLVDEKFFEDNDKVVPVCRPRPCPEGQVMMEFDGKCHWEEEMNAALCEDLSVLTNVFGRSACGDQLTLPLKPQSVLDNVASPICTISNIGRCSRGVTVKLESLPIHEEIGGKISLYL